jgi:hypothetical protein
MSKDDLKEYIKNQTPQKLKNFTVVDKTQTLQPFLIRIDKNPPDSFYPLMPYKATPGEDRTIPRISASLTIEDCIKGYGVFMGDVLSDKMLVKKDKFKNGYVISKLDFDACLIPDKTLVPNAFETNAIKTREHWIVGYDKNHTSIKQKTIGKIVFVSLLMEGLSDKNNDVTVVWYVEVTEPNGVYWNDEILLSEGYHKLEVNQRWEPWQTLHTTISEKEFKEVKKVSAALLSLEHKPAFSKW